VAQRLSVTESYISYIDENAFTSLPSATFVRSYLRNYALYVGLEVDDILAGYQRYLDANIEPVKLRKRQRLKTATSDPIMRLLGILSVLLFVLSSLYFWRTEQAVAPIASAENISVVEVGTVEGETLIEAVDLNSTVEQRVAESILLVTFTDSSWLEVRNGNDEILFSGVKLAGDEIRLTSPSFFDITIGNAAAVKLSYNSAPVDQSTVIQAGNAATLQLGLRQP
jgi:cytoskeletal protein RodZ